MFDKGNAAWGEIRIRLTKNEAYPTVFLISPQCFHAVSLQVHS
jgi:hypothetical protein